MTVPPSPQPVHALSDDASSVRKRSRHSARRPFVAAASGLSLVVGGGIVVTVFDGGPAQGAVQSTHRYADRLLSGEQLLAGQQLVSQNGQYRLVLGTDGVLTLRTPTGGALWQTRAAGPGARLLLRGSDGKLILYSSSGAPVWNDGIVGEPATVVVQDTGHLVAYVGAKARWYTTRQAWGPSLTMPQPKPGAATQPSPPPTTAAKPTSTPSGKPIPSPSPAKSTTPSSAPSASPAATAPKPTSSAPSAAKPATPSAPAATPSAPATGVKPAQPVSAGSRDVRLYPFATSSVWNTPIGSGATFEGASGTRTGRLLSDSKPVVNREAWSIAVAQATSKDPLAVLKVVRSNTSYSLRIPQDTVATAGDDRQVSIFQPDGATAFDAYKATGSGTLWQAEAGSLIDLRGSGMGVGTRAAKVPAFAGLIRSPELQAGSIKHALALAVPGKMLRSGFIWPASAQDSDAATSYGGTIPMGSLFAIPGTVDVEKLGLSKEGLALARALQDYGAYVVDRSDMVTLYCELDCDPTGTTKLREGWRALYPYLRAVTDNSSTSVGGGGEPRVAALAAPR